MKNYRLLLCTTILLLAFTGCSNSAAADTKIASAKSSKATEIQNTEQAELSTGYIILSDNQEYAELYQDTENSNVVARMYYGEPVTIYSLTSDWAEVSYGGMKGYAELKYISFTKPEKQTEAPETEPEVTEAAEIKETVKEETVQPAQHQEALVEQNIKQAVFFIDNDGVEIAEPTHYISYTPLSNSGTLAWCSAQSIYIYSEPSTASYKREADMLYYGDECIIKGSVDGWYYISTDSGNGYDLHGYVKQSYISTGASPAPDEPLYASYGRVNMGSANVRSTPNKETNDNLMFVLNYGDEFTVLDYDGYWYKINYNGTIGYISHKMVEVW